MAAVKIHKTTALPGTLEPNSIYFVSTGAPLAEVYITGALATDVRRAINTADVQAMIDSSIGALSAMEIVADFTERAALTLTANTLVLVLDASDDPTVDSGAATYAYRHSNTSFTKISEAESQDVVLQWANIVGAPSSTPAQIDAAVGAAPSHANKTQLDQIGQDGDGYMTYNGALPATGWSTLGW